MVRRGLKKIAVYKDHAGECFAVSAACPHLGGVVRWNSAEETWDLPGGIQKKLHLHARRIVIPHPAGSSLDVTAPLPQHMQQSWNLLGFEADEAGDADLEDAG